MLADEEAARNAPVLPESTPDVDDDVKAILDGGDDKASPDVVSDPVTPPTSATDDADKATPKAVDSKTDAPAISTPKAVDSKTDVPATLF
jgi:hypothetical protein